MLTVSRRRGRPERDDAGAVAVLVAICALALFAVAALVVDLGLARDTRRQSQNAADAAALAAANVLYPTSGRCTDGTSTPASGCKADGAAAAKQYAEANFELSTNDWSGCTPPPSGFTSVPTYPSCISFDAAGEHVWVVMPVRSVKTGLGNAVGFSKVPVGSGARATIVPGGVLVCGLCVIGPGTHDLGNGDVTVTGASIAFNGNASSGPTSDVTATGAGSTISVEGTASGPNFSPAATQHAGHQDDPLASLVLPLPGTSTATAETNPCSQGPGVYGSLTLPNSTCTLSPGLYVVRGTWSFRNNTLLKGSGVTLYMTCSTGTLPRVCNNEVGGMLDVSNGNTDLAAPTSGPLQGLLIVYDRTNKAALSLQGNGSANLTGTIYAPAATLEFPGNSCSATFHSAVIVGDVSSNGTQACLSLTYASSENWQAPPGDPGLDR